MRCPYLRDYLAHALCRSSPRTSAELVLVSAAQFMGRATMWVLVSAVAMCCLRVCPSRAARMSRVPLFPKSASLLLDSVARRCIMKRQHVPEAAALPDPSPSAGAFAGGMRAPLRC